MNFCVLFEVSSRTGCRNCCKWNITHEFAICYHVDVSFGITVSDWSVEKKIKENKV